MHAAMRRCARTRLCTRVGAWGVTPGTCGTCRQLGQERKVELARGAAGRGGRRRGRCTCGCRNVVLGSVVVLAHSNGWHKAPGISWTAERATISISFITT